MRKLFITVLISGALLLTACSSNEANSEFAVKSDAGNITKEEFYDKLVEQDNGNLLQQLVLEMVLADKYTVDEEEIDERLDEIKEQYGDNYEMVIMQQGYATEREFREALMMSMLYEKAIFEGVEVTDEEIEAAYDRMKVEIEARHILVNTLELATRVKDLLDDDGDFEELVSEYSLDQQTIQSGGDLGYFTALDMVKEFEDAVYAMDVGEISEPIESEHGFHVIHVTDRRDNEDLLSLEEMTTEIRSKIQSSKVNNDEANEKIDQLLIDSNLEIKVPGFEDLFLLNEQDDNDNDDGDNENNNDNEEETE